MSCLCVAEERPALEAHGYHAKFGVVWAFVTLGFRTCRICFGTGMCPAYRKAHGISPLPTSNIVIEEGDE